MCTAALDAEYQREVALSVPLLKSRLEKLHAYGCPSLNCIARPRPRAHVRARASGVAEKTLRFCSSETTFAGAKCWTIAAAECGCGRLIFTVYLYIPLKRSVPRSTASCAFGV